MIELIQAPLAGYSCAPMRKLAYQVGHCDYSCTEMLSAHHMSSGGRQKKRFSYKAPDEGPVCFQLAGKTPEVLAKACDMVQSWGADAIDLNCGCPQPKIRKKGTGSKLLDDPDFLYQLVAAMVAASDVPVSVKIRVDRDEQSLAVAKAVQSAGAKKLIVHGRHWTERYDIASSTQKIKRLVDALSIPVIANGDVACEASAKRVLHETGAAGLMIARASLGQPWIFEQIRCALMDRDFTLPSVDAVKAMLLQHVRELIELESEYPAMLQSRKLVKYYARDIFTVDERVNDMVCFSDLQKLLA